MIAQHEATRRARQDHQHRFDAERFQGGIRVPSYTASKSGVAGLTKLLACEWTAKGVNVNAIAPGYIATDNTMALWADETRNRQILERIPKTAGAVQPTWAGLLCSWPVGRPITFRAIYLP